MHSSSWAQFRYILISGASEHGKVSLWISMNKKNPAPLDHHHPSLDLYRFFATQSIHRWIRFDESEIWSGANSWRDESMKGPGLIKVESKRAHGAGLDMLLLIEEHSPVIITWAPLNNWLGQQHWLGQKSERRLDGVCISWWLSHQILEVYNIQISIIHMLSAWVR